MSHVCLVSARVSGEFVFLVSARVCLVSYVSMVSACVFDECPCVW